MGGVLRYLLLVNCYLRHRDFILLRSGKGFEELLDYIDWLWNRLGLHLYWRRWRGQGLGWRWSLLDDDFLNLIIDEDGLFRQLRHSLLTHIRSIDHHELRILLALQDLVDFL